MKTDVASFLGRLILGFVTLASGAYSQTADSPKPANPGAGQSAVSNAAPAERPAVAPAVSQNQSNNNNEVTLTGIEVRDPKSDPTEVALGKFVVLKLDTPLEVILKKQTPTNKVGLFINDLFLKGLEPMPIPEQPNWVMFQLKRNDDNRDAWSVLFGRKSFFFGDKENVALTVGLQDGSWGAKNPQVLYLEYLPDWRSWLVLPLSFLVAGITIVLGARSSMLRDSGDPRTDGKKGTYSLGRFQMALWFVTVVFAFLFSFAVTGDTSPIPQGTLILMGIGAGTALGAAAIDLNKRTASKSDRATWSAEKTTLPQLIDDLNSKIKNTPTSDPNLTSLQQQLATAQQRLSTVSTQLAQIPSTEVAASEGFILDLLSDENGISFHRLQVFGWTFVFWAVFVSMLFKKVTMVDFDTTQLALMGISGSTYLGFKLQEKQS